MDRWAWWAAVHGVAKSRAWLSDFTFTFHFHALEKEMATHSSILAWRIPGTEEPSGLLSMGSHRVGHDWSDLAAAGTASLFLYLRSQFLIDLSKWYANNKIIKIMCEKQCNKPRSPGKQLITAYYFSHCFYLHFIIICFQNKRGILFYVSKVVSFHL